MRIDSAITYSVSDTVIWQILEDSIVRELDYSTISEPINTAQILQTGILVPIGSKDQLTIEASLGFQAKSGSFFKVFCANINDIILKAGKSLLLMESHTSSLGEDVPITQGYFRAIARPQKLSQENWIYLYKIN